MLLMRKSDWYNKLQEVVELNVSITLVKKYCESYWGEKWLEQPVIIEAKILIEGD